MDMKASSGASEEGLYSIGAVARSTGISPDTLRVWQRRYGFPVPRRKSSGHRLYSSADVRRLRRISEALARGHRPGHVVALSEARLESLLHNQLGMALAAPAGKSVDKLQAAEAEFRASVALPSSQPISWYNLGVVLLRQNRDDEGKEALERYLEHRPMDFPEIELARGMIDNPRRAREPLAPDVTLTTDAGETLRLKELAGKTVLIDFWGTWCGPCRAATPTLVRLNKQFAGQPFAMVGVSSDSVRDRQVWQKYIEVNKMPWFQFLDADRRIHRLFGVSVFPSYIILGADGMIRDRLEGYGPTTASDLESKIKKSLKQKSLSY